MAVGCLTVLVLTLVGGGGAAWYVLSETEGGDDLAELLEELKQAAWPEASEGRPTPPSPRGVATSRPADGKRVRGSPAPDQTALWRTARDPKQPATARLGALAALQAAGVSASELEAIQEKALAESAAGIERERARREGFVRNAASGQWLRDTAPAADAVWRAAGGR